MNFLTIEKFNSRPKTSIFKMMTVFFVVLVVPTMVFTAWIFYNIDNFELTKKTPVVSEEWDKMKLSLVVKGN